MNLTENITPYIFRLPIASCWQAEIKTLKVEVKKSTQGSNTRVPSWLSGNMDTRSNIPRTSRAQTSNHFTVVTSHFTSITNFGSKYGIKNRDKSK